MRGQIDRGSGTVTSLVVVGLLTALACGMLAGVSVIRGATVALRAAESAAVQRATQLSEGDPQPCRAPEPPITRCDVTGTTVTVSVEMHGTRATATAGPQR